MNNVSEILSNIKPANTNFIGTPFEDFYNQQTTSKGKTGEEITKALMKDKGFNVSDRLDKEHDLVADNKKVEVKTAFQKMDGKFTIYGYDPTENPHYWVFTLVSSDEINCIAMDRKAMASIYLGRTRKNAMATVTPEKLYEAGGELVGYCKVA